MKDINNMTNDEVDAGIMEMVNQVSPDMQQRIVKSLAEGWAEQGKVALERDAEHMLTHLEDDEHYQVIVGMYQVSMFVEVSTALSTAANAMARYLSTEKVVMSIADKESK